jgi:hypothetical protein
MHCLSGKCHTLLDKERRVQGGTWENEALGQPRKVGSFCPCFSVLREGDLYCLPDIFKLGNQVQ